MWIKGGFYYEKVIRHCHSFCAACACAPSPRTENPVEVSPRQAYKFLSTAHFTLSYEWDSVQRLTEGEFSLAGMKIAAENIVLADDVLKENVTADGRFPVEDLATAAAEYFDISAQQAAEYFRTLDRYDRTSDTLPQADGIGSLMGTVITDIYVQDGYTCLEYIIQFPGTFTADRMMMKLTGTDGNLKIHSNTALEKSADLSQQISLISISGLVCAQGFDSQSGMEKTLEGEDLLTFVKNLCYADQNIYNMEAVSFTDSRGVDVISVKAGETDRALKDLFGLEKQEILQQYYSRETDSYLIPADANRYITGQCFYLNRDEDGNIKAQCFVYPSPSEQIIVQADLQSGENGGFVYCNVPNLQQVS